MLFRAPGRLRLGALLLVITGSAVAQPRPASEQIGSWVLSCPTEPQTATCQLRYQSWVLPPAGSLPGAALEVVSRGGQLVPVIAVRGLTLQTALGGALALQANVGLRFDNTARTALGCSLDGAAVVCAPEGSAATSAAEQLAIARSVLVQIQLSLSGAAPLPDLSRTLELQGTQEALARFRATAPVSETMPVIQGLDWRGFLERVLRDAGFDHWVADVLPGGRR